MIDTTAQDDLSIPALRSGDRAEFARLVDAYSAPIYRLGLRMLGNEQDAEDVLQNTFINALTHLSSFEGRSSILTWLYRIAVNEALMSLRRGRPEISIDDFNSSEDDDHFHPSQFVDWGALPEDELLSNEGKQALETAIQNLPENLRMVFLLRDIQGLSIKDTADTLEITESNVKIRLLRARLSLREQLSFYYGERINQEKTND
ncbi:MAG: sigma-70 family RNA polymerase sigma factor [Anaerolineales bacterium]|uniref:RNA polymerase sigma factor n=1 Tax=Candidatus Villigracilis proximus TaxID=3140683 RepID=UPI0031356F74|nr:sigma-70 family RNA polymerase sigma factor [Anaerolineales bacterium]